MTRSLSALALCALLAACSTAPFRTDDDPLVQAHLERLLNEERIAYKRTYDGQYMALNAEQQSRLRQLGKSARRLDAERRSLVLDDSCAASKLRSLLRSADALYAVDREMDGTYLQMRDSDFRELDIAAQYETFRRECAE